MVLVDPAGGAAGARASSEEASWTPATSPSPSRSSSRPRAAHRPRPLLPARQRGLPAPGGRAAAAGRGEPRRPDRRGGQRRCDLQLPVLHQPRHRAWSTSTTAAAPATAAPTASACEGQWGIVDVEDCVAAARYLAARGDVDGTGWPSAAAAPAATPPCARSPSATTSPPGPATTAWPTSRRWPRDTHKFESPLPRPPGRPLARGRGALPRAVADPLHRPAVAAR